MRFGRVVGTLSPLTGHDDALTGPHSLYLVVTLEDGARVSVVRSETVSVLPAPPGATGLAWQADQYTQETIGNELALAGWEPIGIAAQDEVDTLELTASSPTYVVRFL